VGDERLGFEVVLEGDGFDVFLYTASDVTLVAPGVDTLQVWDE